MVAVAVIQSSFGSDRLENVGRIESLARQAASDGAQIIVPPELFEGPYFPQRQDERFFSWAQPRRGHPTLAKFSALCRELGVVIPVSFFERAGQVYYNSLAVFDADGSLAGYYRKSHIPDGPGYSEKFYFRPGDTGFHVARTRYGALGLAVCWDQWFPEVARALTLLGAELLMYPTAIGSEPADPTLDTSQAWRRAMVGHAVCNSVPVAAANRAGQEDQIHFYGKSFVADCDGEVVAEADGEQAVAIADIDLTRAQSRRDSFGFFRDRRTDLYSVLLGADGDRG